MIKAFQFKDKINPFKMLSHPIDTVESLKDKRNGSVVYASLILLAYTIAEIIKTVATGFLFTTAKIQDFNVIIVLARSMFMILIFVLANWSFCTLLEGEGRMVDIYVATCYSLPPLIFLQIFQTICSRVMAQSEYVFVEMIAVAIYIWFGSLVIFSLKRIHNYSFLRMVFNLIVTVLGMAIIFFLIFLFAILMQQLYIFIATIVTEIIIRL